MRAFTYEYKKALASSRPHSHKLHKTAQPTCNQHHIHIESCHHFSAGVQSVDHWMGLRAQGSQQLAKKRRDKNKQKKKNNKINKINNSLGLANRDTKKIKSYRSVTQSVYRAGYSYFEKGCWKKCARDNPER